MLVINEIYVVVNVCLAAYGSHMLSLSAMKSYRALDISPFRH
jgi:hypothetical protein